MKRAVVIGLMVTAACHRAGDNATAAAEVNVQTALAIDTPFAEEVTAIGVISPRPDRYAEMGAPAPTRVARILAGAGQPVHAGDTLVIFERAPFDAAARSADAALTTAQHAADRAMRLVQAGILPRKDGDQAAQALADAQGASVTAHRNQELAALRAPFDGVVTRMTAIVGAPVDATQALVAVADPHALDILFALSPEDAARIHPGDGARLWAGESAQGDSLGLARIADVGAIVDSLTRNVSVRARLLSTTRALRLGEVVFARIEVALHRHAVVIPREALVPAAESAAFQVFVVDSMGIAHARAVMVGGRGEGLVEITGGLKAGEMVVTTGAYGVADGAHITTTSHS